MNLLGGDLVNKPENYAFKIQFGSALAAEWLAEAGFPKLPPLDEGGQSDPHKIAHQR
jgi:hypothetical protein